MKRCIVMGLFFQYGTQQRSFNTHCAYGCELVRNGYIGELKEVHVIAPNGATGGKPGPDPVPEGFDYNMWLGPSPVVPYANDRVVGGGRWHIYDYALGFYRRMGSTSSGHSSLGLSAYTRRVLGYGKNIA